MPLIEISDVAQCDNDYEKCINDGHYFLSAHGGGNLEDDDQKK